MAENSLQSSVWLASRSFDSGADRPWGGEGPSYRWRTRFSRRPIWRSSAPVSFSPEVNKWLVTVAVMLATVMEMLDVTIANVALDHIRGSLSASVDEATWVLTSYIVANGIVLALTGWLSNVFGRKRFFNFCILVFTASSFLCGASPNLETLVLFRIVQGAAGGAMVPLSQAILLETFPPKEHAMAMAVWGIGMMVAPIVGPILGGWITDNYSWRWIFYVNVPVGLLASFLVTVVLVDPPYLKRAVKSIDWWGLGFLITGIGALQIMLDSGERADWFDSNFIVTLSIGAVVGLVLTVIRELQVEEPVVDLRLLQNRTFAVGTAFMTVAMFGMYGTFVLLPLYCQLVAGYTPLLAGQVLTIQSLGTFLSMVLAGRFFNRTDPRYFVSAGCLMAGIGTWYMTHFNPDVGFWEIAWPGFFRGVGSGLIFVPVTTITLGSVAKEQTGNASALFNMVRAIGGGIGIAVLTSLLSRGTQIHQHHLTAYVHAYNPALWERFGQAAFTSGRGLEGSGVPSEAFLALIYNEVQRQALLLSFVDDFRLIAYLFFALIPAIFLMRRPQPGGGVAAH